MLRCVLYIPPMPDADRWRDLCTAYCVAHRYRIVAVVTDWEDVRRMLNEGGADVVVVARPDHLPADRIPRIEIVSEAAAMTIAQQRPRRRNQATHRDA